MPEKFKKDVAKLENGPEQTLETRESRELYEWAKEEGDPWLLGEVTNCLKTDSEYFRLVAAGVLLRLWVPSAEQAHATKKQIEENRKNRFDRIYDWVKRIPKDEIEKAEDLAGIEAAGLRDELEKLHGNPRPDDEGWRSALLSSLRVRDELEGVQILLEEAGAGEKLKGVLKDLDENGDDIVRSLPWEGEIKDEHLSRASASDPDAWWVSLFDRSL